MNGNSRQSLLFVGAVLVVLGAIFLLFGLSGFMQRLLCPNVASGCPDYTMYWNEVYAGISMVVLGVAIMIVSRYVQEKILAGVFAAYYAYFSIVEYSPVVFLVLFELVYPSQTLPRQHMISAPEGLFVVLQFYPQLSSILSIFSDRHSLSSNVRDYSAKTAHRAGEGIRHGSGKLDR